MKYKLIRNRNLAEDEEFLNKNKWFVGYDKENRAEILEFEIPENLNDYAKKINFDLGTEKVSDILNQDNTYILKNNITQYKQVSFYLEFVKEIDNNTTEILKTEVKTIEFGDSFDVNTEITEEEISIIDTLIAQTNDAINRANAISEDLENKVATDYYRGATGENGADAKINGVNTLTIEAGTNITLDQEGNTLTINSTGGSGGTSDYTNLTNKPKINNVELKGNKTLNDLGIQPAGNYALESEIPTKTSDLTNDSGFIDKNVNNLTNYYKTSETYNKTEIDNKISSVYKYKGTVATYANLPSSDLTVGDVYNVESTGDNYAWTGTVWDKLGGDIDLSGYQPKIDSTHKLSSDLVDDTGNTNKFVTTSEKQTWNNKLDSEDLTDYVKNSNYADNSNFGVVKTNYNYGIQTENGVLYINRASAAQIISRHQWAPITPKNFDLALKLGMCDGVGEAWTEDEKLKAQERIGVSKIPSGMTLTADVVLEESVERVNFNKIIVKNYEKLIIYVFRPATIFSSGYGSISFTTNVGGGLGGTEYNAFSTNQKISVRHTMVKTDGTKFEATTEWVNAGNNINDTAFIKSTYKPEANPYSGYLVINTTQTYPIGTHILIYTK